MQDPLIGEVSLPVRATSAPEPTLRESSFRGRVFREPDAVLVDTASVAIQRWQLPFSFVKMGSTATDHNAEVCMNCVRALHACVLAWLNA